MNTNGAALGINGLGRIGKLLVWHHVARGHFSRLVVNVGREVGRGLDAVCGVIEQDSTYGAMHRFLFGVGAEPCIRIVDEASGLIEVAGVPVTVLQKARNPSEIGWRDHGVRVVIDATGAFDDPTRPADRPSGALRGHLAAGADKVIYSAAFKIDDKTLPMPDDAITLIYGINHDVFDPIRHHVVSAASCTTTALAHMLRPIIDRLPATQLMTASMSTVHAATNSQSLLDSVPAAGAKDLRRTRSASRISSSTSDLLSGSSYFTMMVMSSDSGCRLWNVPMGKMMALSSGFAPPIACPFSSSLQARAGPPRSTPDGAAR